MESVLQSLKEQNIITQSKELIKRVYRLNDIPWVIGYSGGKDSTVVAQLVFESLQELIADGIELTKQVYVISSDTMVETPPVMAQIADNMNKIQTRAEELNIPIQTQIVKPLVSQSFWANIIGRGYPTPNQTFRWCTDRLKINPANAFIRETVSEYGEAIMVLGIREGESASRDKVINDHHIQGKDLMKHSTLTNAFIFAPIRPFTTDDVWDYLLNHPSPWGADNYKLYELYADSSSTECPLVIDKETKEKAGSCGNSRFGCWTCTVVNEDKALSGFIENGEEWLRPLLRFRNWLATIRDDRRMRMKRRTMGSVYFSPIVGSPKDNQMIIPKKTYRQQLVLEKADSNRHMKQEGQIWHDNEGNEWRVFESQKQAWKYIKDKNIDLDSSIDPRIIAQIRENEYGQLGLGPFTMEARKEILRELLKVERDLEANLQLISEEELFEIRRIWLENGDMKDRVPEIYREVYAQELDWEQDHVPLFSDEQLEEIRKLCDEYEVDFGLYKKLINIEKKYLGNTVRKKALQEIQSYLNMDYLYIGEIGESEYASKKTRNQ